MLSRFSTLVGSAGEIFQIFSPRKLNTLPARKINNDFLNVNTLFLLSSTYHVESNVELIIISSAVQITFAFYSHPTLNTGFPFHVIARRVSLLKTCPTILQSAIQGSTRAPLINYKDLCLKECAKPQRV